VHPQAAIVLKYSPAFQTKTNRENTLKTAKRIHQTTVSVNQNQLTSAGKESPDEETHPS
jgi:hypothetical protein